MGITQIGREVAIDLPIHHRVKFAADIGIVGERCANHTAGQIVNGIVSALTPEEMLIELKRDGGAEVEDQPRMHVDDVLAAENIEVAKISVSRWKQLIKPVSRIGR